MKFCRPLTILTSWSALEALQLVKIATGDLSVKPRAAGLDFDQLVFDKSECDQFEAGGPEHRSNLGWFPETFDSLFQNPAVQTPVVFLPAVKTWFLASSLEAIEL